MQISPYTATILTNTRICHTNASPLNRYPLLQILVEPFQLPLFLPWLAWLRRCCYSNLNRKNQNTGATRLPNFFALEFVTRTRHVIALLASVDGAHVPQTYSLCFCRAASGKIVKYNKYCVSVFDFDQVRYPCLEDRTQWSLFGCADCRITKKKYYLKNVRKE